MSWFGALAVGGMVGLGVAMPLGAIGVLVLQTGMTRGWCAAVVAGLGVATVDLGYATVAVLAGAAASTALAGHGPVLRVGGALVLGAVAVRGLAGLRRQAVGDAAAPAETSSGPGPARTFLRFVGLTAVNPLTVVYFTAVVATLVDRLVIPGDRVAFVAGIGAASAGWQLGLAGVGAALGARVGPRLRAALAMVAYGVVTALALAVAVGR